ncbi:MAG: (2Fe-2S)-binding protein, partial [Candidatus Aminicenantes bacterium]|nr:(2Fe-2S)-binding protein [Candidatus Aminicenantes bacterium]
MEKPSRNKRKFFTRRDFLKGLGGGAAGTALASRFLGRPSVASAQEPDQARVYSKKPITFSVNGRTVSLEVEPRETLLEVLRDRLRLTGTKSICGRGECGGCTVLLDGQPVYSCLYFASRADGKAVITIEGLAEGDNLHPVQQAYIDKDGYQCGFCTPGFILSSVALLNKTQTPSEKEIKTALSGNLCRCGNYPKIYEAVAAASKKMRKA